MIGLIFLAVAVIFIFLLIVLIGTALTGLIGGTALAVAGRSLNKSEKRKTLAKVLTIIGVIFLVVGIAAVVGLIYII